MLTHTYPVTELPNKEQIKKKSGLTPYRTNSTFLLGAKLFYRTVNPHSEDSAHQRKPNLRRCHVYSPCMIFIGSYHSYKYLRFVYEAFIVDIMSFCWSKIECLQSCVGVDSWNILWLEVERHLIMLCHLSYNWQLSQLLWSLLLTLIMIWGL